jgi:hypothetical protein
LLDWIAGLLNPECNPKSKLDFGFGLSIQFFIPSYFYPEKCFAIKFSKFAVLAFFFKLLDCDWIWIGLSIHFEKWIWIDNHIFMMDLDWIDNPKKSD